MQSCLLLTVHEENVHFVVQALEDASEDSSIVDRHLDRLIEKILFDVSSSVFLFHCQGVLK